MPAPPDFGPLIKRIEGVLERGEGLARTLPEDRRFGVGILPTDETPLIRVQGTIVRRVFAMISSAEFGPPGEFSNRKDFGIRAQLTFYYWLEDVTRWENVRQALIDAATDMLFVRAALCFGGNLDTDQDGNATGLNGGAFIDGFWDLQEPDADERLLTATMLLNGSASFYNP